MAVPGRIPRSDLEDQYNRTTSGRQTGSGPKASGSYYASRYGSPTAIKNASSYYGSQTASNRASQAAQSKVAAQQAAQANYFKGLSQELSGIGQYNGMPLNPGGLTAADYAMINANTPTLGGPGSGGSGRSGGGSGGGSGGDPAQLKAALDAYMASIGKRVNPYADTSRIAGMYSDAPVNARYDKMVSDVSGAGQAARSRLDEIVSGLTARTQTAGANIAQGFSNRNNVLQQLAAELTQGQESDQGSMNRVMAANSAGSVQAETAPLQNFIQASKTSLGDAANMFAQSMADRAAISGQLGADVGLGMTRDQSGLESQIAARRAADLAGNQDRRNQMLADWYIREMDWQAAQQREAEQLKLEMARLGIA